MSARVMLALAAALAYSVLHADQPLVSITAVARGRCAQPGGGDGGWKDHTLARTCCAPARLITWHTPAITGTTRNCTWRHRAAAERL